MSNPNKPWIWIIGWAIIMGATTIIFGLYIGACFMDFVDTVS